MLVTFQNYRLSLKITIGHAQSLSTDINKAARGLWEKAMPFIKRVAIMTKKKPNKILDPKKGLKFICTFLLTASTGLVKNMTSLYKCSFMDFGSYSDDQNYYY